MSLRCRGGTSRILVVYVVPRRRSSLNLRFRGSAYGRLGSFVANRRKLSGLQAPVRSLGLAWLRVVSYLHGNPQGHNFGDWSDCCLLGDCGDSKQAPRIRGFIWVDRVLGLVSSCMAEA